MSSSEHAGWLLAGGMVVMVAAAAILATAGSSTEEPPPLRDDGELPTMLPGLLPPSAQGSSIADAPPDFRAAEEEASALGATDERTVVRCRVPLPPGATLAPVGDASSALWSGHVVLIAEAGETERDLHDASGARIGQLRWQATPTGHACTWMRN